MHAINKAPHTCTRTHTHPQQPNHFTFTYQPLEGFHPTLCNHISMPQVFHTHKHTHPRTKALCTHVPNTSVLHTHVHIPRVFIPLSTKELYMHTHHPHCDQSTHTSFTSFTPSPKVLPILSHRPHQAKLPAAPQKKPPKHLGWFASAADT